MRDTEFLAAFCFGLSENFELSSLGHGREGLKINLAGERAEEVWILQASVTGAAKIAGAPEVPSLWPVVQKHHFCTVCCV